MLDKIYAQLDDLRRSDELEPDGLLLLNLIHQIQQHPKIDWNLETVNDVVKMFEQKLDDLEE